MNPHCSALPGLLPTRLPSRSSLLVPLDGRPNACNSRENLQHLGFPVESESLKSDFTLGMHPNKFEGLGNPIVQSPWKRMLRLCPPLIIGPSNSE